MATEIGFQICRNVTDIWRVCSCRWFRTGAKFRIMRTTQFAYLTQAFVGIGACTSQPGLGAFEQALAVHDSATSALTSWCSARKIADPPVIAARQVKGEMAAPSPAMRGLLAAGPDEPIRYRHVELLCGSTVLSVVENWYVPSRLTAAMNAALDSSDAAFGRVAAPLKFARRRLDSRRGQAEGFPDGTILSNRAILQLPDGRPISLVMECYTAANLTAS
jgi:hypothetical protein